MTRRVRRSAEQWQAIIDEQTNAGVSARQYCKSNDLSYPVFCKWRRRLAPNDPAPLMDLTGLVTPQRPSAWDIELDLGDGITLRLRRG